MWSAVASLAYSGRSLASAHQQSLAARLLGVDPHNPATLVPSPCVQGAQGLIPAMSDALECHGTTCCFEFKPRARRRLFTPVTDAYLVPGTTHPHPVSRPRRQCWWPLSGRGGCGPS